MRNSSANPNANTPAKTTATTRLFVHTLVAAVLAFSTFAPSQARAITWNELKAKAVAIFGGKNPESPKAEPPNVEAPKPEPKPELTPEEKETQRREQRLATLPEPLKRFYDLEKDEFRYVSERPLSLARENGDDALRALRINFSNSIQDNEISATLVNDYLQALESLPGVELWVVIAPNNIDQLKAIASRYSANVRSRIRIAPFDSKKTLYIWAQDGSKPAADGKTSVMPPNLPRASYAESVYQLEKENLARTDKSTFPFEGGNVIVGDKNIFVGSDLITRLTLELSITREEALRALSEEFRKAVIEVGFPGEHRTSRFNPGGTSQVDFHIDLTMAVVRDRTTGEEVVLVESVRKSLELLAGEESARQIFGDRTIQNPWVEIAENMKDRMKTDLTKAEKILIMFTMPRLSTALAQRERRLNRIAEQLETRGYRVMRIPGVADIQMERSAPSGVGQIINYTNAIFSKDAALMPQFDVRPLDNYMQKLMGSLGYRFFPVKSPRASLCKEGGLRCMTETHRKATDPIGELCRAVFAP